MKLLKKALETLNFNFDDISLNSGCVPEAGGHTSNDVKDLLDAISHMCVRDEGSCGGQVDFCIVDLASCLYNDSCDIDTKSNCLYSDTCSVDNKDGCVVFDTCKIDGNFGDQIPGYCGTGDVDYIWYDTQGNPIIVDEPLYNWGSHGHHDNDHSNGLDGDPLDDDTFDTGSNGDETGGGESNESNNDGEGNSNGSDGGTPDAPNPGSGDGPDDVIFV
jgi:hypothetical protein